MDLRDAHLGIQVENLDRACTLLSELFGLTFAEPITSWPISVRVGDEIEESEGRFTVSRQGPPYLEVTENVAGSRVWHSDGQPMAFHHLGFWVDDVEAESTRLAEAGYPAQAGGLDEQGRYRYTYHEVEGLRVEMAGASARAAFERWAVTGVAEGASAAFERGRADADPNADEELGA
jgi:catechol 2,3-dioxygenase-like lactoylglutathione lyase family enzyme